MLAWIFRNRRRLEVIYGAPGRARPLLEPRELGSGDEREVASRCIVYEMIPRPARKRPAETRPLKRGRYGFDGREAA